MPDLLTSIYRDRLRRLEQEQARTPLSKVRAQARLGRSARRSLALALDQGRPPILIAEMKRASPSAGLIAGDLDPAEIASQYQAAGANAISVLTEEDHFQGRLEDLDLARAGSDLPLLRKDFLTSPYQVVQSAAHGADAILAIVAGLTDLQLADLLTAAEEWQLDVLVEVHTEAELARALALGASLIGVNNRDLRTLRTDLAVTERLLRLVPPGVQVVSESGYASAAQVERALQLGVRAFLVGEALMRSPDRAAWIGAARALAAGPA